MALNPFKLPQIGPMAITDPRTGKTTNYFQSVWGQMTDKVTGFFVDLAAIQATQAAQQAQLTAQVTQIQNALAQAQAAAVVANVAQTSADGGAVPSARSGSNSATFSLTGSSFSTGPSVILSTVSAGDLTITGTGPAGSGSTAGLPLVGPSGEFRILENGVDLGFLGNWQSSLDPYGSGDIIITNQSIDAVTAYVSTRATTGTVTYDLQFRRTGGTAGPVVFDAYLYVRRA